MRGIKILLALILGLVAYQWYASRVDVEKALSTPVVAHNELIMYSLTTCGYCKQKRRQLEAANIPFTEHFIDVDRQRQKELNEKLARSGHFARGYGTPIFDAYGYILPNNPSVAKIQSMKSVENVELPSD